MALEPASNHHRASRRGRSEVLPFCCSGGKPEVWVGCRMVGVVGESGQQSSQQLQWTANMLRHGCCAKEAKEHGIPQNPANFKVVCWSPNACLFPPVAVPFRCFLYKMEPKVRGRKSPSRTWVSA